MEKTDVQHFDYDIRDPTFEQLHSCAIISSEA